MIQSYFNLGAGMWLDNFLELVLWCGLVVGFVCLGVEAAMGLFKEDFDSEN